MPNLPMYLPNNTNFPSRTRDRDHKSKSIHSFSPPTQVAHPSEQHVTQAQKPGTELSRKHYTETVNASSGAFELCCCEVIFHTFPAVVHAMFCC